LSKPPGAVCQEIKRNSANTKTRYNAKIAKDNYTNRRIKTNKRFKKQKIMIGLKNTLL
jgi:IS30 family transposase